MGIKARMIVVLYFSRKQMQALSIDIETKILNDFEKIHRITQMGVEHPELIKVLSNVPPEYSSSYVPFAYHILYTFAHVFHMCSRATK
ncbi:MAG TPA: hypothetical protein VJ250_08700 [Nitrososphaeraceae archaeon]|nr:hypothetical protein [Nitrososphaeraceae archaeon]